MRQDIKLGVNIDHVATLRQVRKTTYPDPLLAAMLAEMAGADSIVCHLREDRRHIQEQDLELLRKTVKTRLNLEMALSDEIIQIALKVKPDQVTIVPERRQELTTEGGLDVSANKEKLVEVIPLFYKNNIKVSIFVDPDIVQITHAKEAGARIIEIHTGRYADATDYKQIKEELERIKLVAKIARTDMGLFVAAGHGLNYQNVAEISRIPEIEELNIGHSIVARSVFVGFYQAVQEMKKIITESRVYSLLLTTTQFQRG